MKIGNTCFQIGSPLGVPNADPISTGSISSPHQAIEKCYTAHVVSCYPIARDQITRRQKTSRGGFGKNTKRMFRIGPSPGIPARALCKNQKHVFRNTINSWVPNIDTIIFWETLSTRTGRTESDSQKIKKRPMRGVLDSANWAILPVTKSCGQKGSSPAGSFLRSASNFTSN